MRRFQIRVKPDWIPKVNKILGCVFLVSMAPTVWAYFTLGPDFFVKLMVLVNTLISLWTAAYTHFGTAAATEAKIEASDTS